MRSEVIQQMERIVDEHFYVEPLRQQLKHFIQEKYRERSIWSDITYHCHLMLGGRSPHIDTMGAITEMMMLALDIVDDLQDQDNLEKPWMICPPQYALNAAFSLVFSSLSEMDKLSLSDHRNDRSTIGHICRYITNSGNGQFVDIEASIHTEEDYVHAIQQKSGSLFQFVCYMGYSGLEQQPEAEVIQNIEEYAAYIGIIHQLENDIRDVQRYDIKNDLLQKKKTLPVLFLLKHSDEDFPEFKQYYEGRLSEEQFTSKKLACLEYISNSGCIEYSRIIQTLFVDRAEQILSRLPAQEPWKEKFAELTISPFLVNMDKGVAQLQQNDN